MEFTLKMEFNTSAENIYTAWMSSEGHTNMTGGEAAITDKVGESFTAWDGYIEGKNIELEPFSRIVQSWRTTQFEDDEEDSIIEILLEEIDKKTELTLIHTNLGEDGAHYEKGWQDYYFTPMKGYFS